MRDTSGDIIDQQDAHIARLEDALIECAREAGADVSGGRPTSPPIDEWALGEVKQLRQDHECEANERRQFFNQAVDLAREARETNEQLTEVRVRLGIAESFIPVEKLSVYEARLAGRELAVLHSEHGS